MLSLWLWLLLSLLLLFLLFRSVVLCEFVLGVLCFAYCCSFCVACMCLCRLLLFVSHVCIFKHGLIVLTVVIVVVLFCFDMSYVVLLCLSFCALFMLLFVDLLRFVSFHEFVCAIMCLIVGVVVVVVVALFCSLLLLFFCLQCYVFLFVFVSLTLLVFVSRLIVFV